MNSSYKIHTSEASECVMARFGKRDVWRWGETDTDQDRDRRRRRTGSEPRKAGFAVGLAFSPLKLPLL